VDLPTLTPMVAGGPPPVMRARRVLLVPGLAVAVTAALLLAPTSSPAAPVPEAPACPMTPADSFWHADVSALPVHAQSATWVGSIGATAGLKADFGAGMWDGGPIGIPYATVPGTQQRVPVSFDYADESDPGPYPIPPDAPIEGGPQSDGDRHVLIVDRDQCRLWETWSSYPQNGGTSWHAGSGATWDLRSNAMRPLGWTSADAAGLPILPGLVRYDEVASGEIDHVIRFTAPRTDRRYVWPASHQAGTSNAAYPPMGSWLRLKASVDISDFSATNQVILRALKKHGMVLADNGSAWFMSGAPDPRWDDDDLQDLRSIPGSSFEVVNVSSLPVSATSYAVQGGTPPTTAPPNTTTTVASTTVPPSTTSTTSAPGSPNLVTNPGFEANLAGWVAGTKTALQRVNTPHSGAWSVRVTRASGTGNAVLDDSPSTVASAASRAYTASAWVSGPVGLVARLLVVERRGTTTVRQTTADATLTSTAWRKLSLTVPAPAAGNRLDVRVMGRSMKITQYLCIDDVELR
jgi:hypothetical protein